MKPFLLLSLALSLYVYGPACADADTLTERKLKEVVARVDGNPIYRRDVNRWILENENPATNSGSADEKPVSKDDRRAAARQLRRETLESLIDRELLNREAARRGLRADEKKIEEAWTMMLRDSSKGQDSPDEQLISDLKKSGFTPDQYKEELRKQARVRLLKKQMFPPADAISDEDIERCYKRYKSRFVAPARVRLSRIIVPVSPQAAQPAVETAREQAESLKSRLDAGTSFEQLARESPLASVARTGGDIGWKTRGELDDELGDLAFSLDVHEIGGPVRTGVGFVLIKVVDKRPERVYTLEEARDNIVKYLRRDRRDRDIEKLLTELRKSADIEYVVQP